MASLIAPVSALLISVAFLMLGHGMQTTIIPIRAEIEMLSGTAIGIISSFFYVGFVIGCVTAPFLIVRAGHIRAFAAMVSTGSAVALLHPLFIDPFIWSFARGITGFCVAGLYLIIESWLNERATNTTRGLVMSAYTVIVSSGIMIGQFSTVAWEPSGNEAFIMASIALSIAVVPIALTKSAQPAPIAIVKFRPLQLYQTSPAAIVAVTVAGFAIGSLFSLLPVFGARVGMDASLIPIFAGAMMLGGLVLQYPLGRVSDWVDRRYILIVASAGAIGVALFMTLGGVTDAYVLIFLVILLGGLVLPLYAISAAHAFDYAEQEDIVEVAAGVLLANGIGAIFGPLIASIGMDLYGPNMLFFSVATVLSFLVVFLLLRITRRATLSSADKSDYDLASGAPVGAVIAPDLYESADDYVLVPEEYEEAAEEDEGTTHEIPYALEEEDEGTP